MSFTEMVSNVDTWFSDIADKHLLLIRNSHIGTVFVLVCIVCVFLCYLCIVYKTCNASNVCKLNIIIVREKME